MTSPEIASSVRDRKFSRSAEHPRVSVVMTLTQLPTSPFERLDALSHHDGAAVESLLVCAAGIAESMRGIAGLRAIRVVSAPASSTLEDMRALGALSAKGDVIVILGEHDRFDDSRLPVLMNAAIKSESPARRST